MQKSSQETGESLNKLTQDTVRPNTTSSRSQIATHKDFRRSFEVLGVVGDSYAAESAHLADTEGILAAS